MSMRKRVKASENSKKNESHFKPSNLAKSGQSEFNSNKGNMVFVNRGKRLAGVSFLPFVILFMIVLIGGFYLVDYLHEIHDDCIASHATEITRLFVDIPCSKDYGSGFQQCVPKRCGRCIMDNLFEKEKMVRLRQIAEKGLKYGGSNGGASILDLHSGALSRGEKFINIYSIGKKIFSKGDFELYKEIKDKIHETVANEFGIPKTSLYLTKPTFFSRINGKPAKTLHDEYWHPHIDKETYKSFYYTSLLYLTEYGVDFQGGRFMFVGFPSNKTVEPRVGRLSFFTSGSENQHFVEPVESGTRYAITVSFTCDRKFAINDPGERFRQPTTF